jgi:putative hydrolase of the HAD superfamily
MVGDDENNDIMGAKNAGIDQVFYNPQKVTPLVEPTFVITGLAELKKIL